MRDYSCHTVSFIINAFEKSANFSFKGHQQLFGPITDFKKIALNNYLIISGFYSQIEFTIIRKQLIHRSNDSSFM